MRASGPTSTAAVISNTAVIVFREGLEAVLIIAALLAGMVGIVLGYSSGAALQPSLQFAGDHPLTAATAYNSGVVLAAGAVFAVLTTALNASFGYVSERAGIIVLSAIARHSSWHWLIDRGNQLWRFSWPAFDAVMLAGLLRILMVVVFVAGLGWLLVTVRGKHLSRS